MKTFLFVAFTIICLVLSPKLQAIGPEPNDGDLTGNMAEEDDAVVELGRDTVEAVTETAKTPNKRVINFNFKKPLQCAGGDVIISGNVVITFKHIATGVVWPDSIKFDGFKGTAKIGNRKLLAKGLRVGGGIDGISAKHENGRGDGRFDFEFLVKGPGLPGGKPVKIRVFYQKNTYIFHQGEVKKLTPDDTPSVRCCDSCVIP